MIFIFIINDKTSIILQTNNENDNTFGDSHFSIILPYTKDHLWAMQLNSFNFRPMFNIFEKNTQYLKVKLSLRYFEPHQSPPDDKWEKKDWVNILSKHVYLNMFILFIMKLYHF